MHYTNCPTSLLCSPLSHCDANVTITAFEPLAD
jgi:hypothetical protein